MNTKQEILRHAMLLLKQYGYHNWSYDHISKKIGIKKASIHYYFPSKELLVAEVLKIYIQTFFNQLDFFAKSPLTNYKKIQSLIALYRENYTNEKEICLCTILASDYQILSKEISDQLKFFYAELQKWLCHVILCGIKAKEFRKKIHVESYSQMIINTLQGLLITSKVLGSLQTFDSCMNQLCDSLKK